MMPTSIRSDAIPRVAGFPEVRSVIIARFLGARSSSATVCITVNNEQAAVFDNTQLSIIFCFATFAFLPDWPSSYACSLYTMMGMEDEVADEVPNVGSEAS